MSSSKSRPRSQLWFPPVRHRIAASDRPSSQPTHPDDCVLPGVVYRPKPTRQASDHSGSSASDVSLRPFFRLSGVSEWPFPQIPGMAMGSSTRSGEKDTTSVLVASKPAPATICNGLHRRAPDCHVALPLSQSARCDHRARLPRRTAGPPLRSSGTDDRALSTVSCRPKADALENALLPLYDARVCLNARDGIPIWGMS